MIDCDNGRFAVQVVSNILDIIYMRNILLGTRRIADVLGANQELTKGITVTEKNI